MKILFEVEAIPYLNRPQSELIGYEKELAYFNLPRCQHNSTKHLLAKMKHFLLLLESQRDFLNCYLALCFGAIANSAYLFCIIIICFSHHFYSYIDIGYQKAFTKMSQRCQTGIILKSLIKTPQLKVYLQFWNYIFFS